MPYPMSAAAPSWQKKKHEKSRHRSAGGYGAAGRPLGLGLARREPLPLPWEGSPRTGTALGFAPLRHPAGWAAAVETAPCKWALPGRALEGGPGWVFKAQLSAVRPPYGHYLSL